MCVSVTQVGTLESESVTWTARSQAKESPRFSSGLWLPFTLSECETSMPKVSCVPQGFLAGSRWAELLNPP